MATPAQPGSPAAKPAPAPAPTNASLPIMGPATQPIVHAFTPPPMRGAQLAAHNRKLNAAGISPAKDGAAASPKPAPATARPMGVELVLCIAPVEGGLCVSFAHRNGDGPCDPALVPEAEAGLSALRATGIATPAGDLEPGNGMAFTATNATANQMAAALPLMRKLDGLLNGAYRETEDPSFPQMVLTLASGLRVDRIEVRQPDGSVAASKRGAAYIAAFKAWEAHKPRAS